MKYYSGYAKTIYLMVKKQVCYRGHSELPLTYKTFDKLGPFDQPICTSQDAIEGPKKRQVSSEVHGPYGEILSWVNNWLQQINKGRGKILLPLVNMTTIN